mmetsp:Transcript_38567/g.106229  ORF Transcript_38567/g.106229 Transcript_38567/m.106229 type:complete len:543 (-) Transcript_38567:2012-3640(-)
MWLCPGSQGLVPSQRLHEAARGSSFQALISLWHRDKPVTQPRVCPQCDREQRVLESCGVEFEAQAQTRSGTIRCSAGGTVGKARARCVGPVRRQCRSQRHEDGPRGPRGHKLDLVSRRDIRDPLDPSQTRRSGVRLWQSHVGIGARCRLQRRHWLMVDARQPQSDATVALPQAQPPNAGTKRRATIEDDARRAAARCQEARDWNVGNQPQGIAATPRLHGEREVHGPYDLQAHVQPQAGGPSAARSCELGEGSSQRQRGDVTAVACPGDLLKRPLIGAVRPLSHSQHGAGQVSRSQGAHADLHLIHRFVDFSVGRPRQGEEVPISLPQGRRRLRCATGWAQRVEDLIAAFTQRRRHRGRRPQRKVARVGAEAKDPQPQRRTLAGAMGVHELRGEVEGGQGALHRGPIERGGVCPEIASSRLSVAIPSAERLLDMAAIEDTNPNGAGKSLRTDSHKPPRSLLVKQWEHKVLVLADRHSAHLQSAVDERRRGVVTPPRVYSVRRLVEAGEANVHPAGPERLAGSGEAERILLANIEVETPGMAP